VWIIDDTGLPKQGKHSVGVQRQYSGTLGKVGNCQVGVSLSAAMRHEHVPIDFELYMPESWTEDKARCKKARVPADLVLKTKTELALDLISRAMDNKIPGEIVLADAAYGGSAEFRNTVKKLRPSSKFYRFLWEVRGELFDGGLEEKLIAAYEPRGQKPCPPAMLAMATLLQRYEGISDADAVDAAENDRRWQLVLGVLGAEESPFGQGSLVRFRQRMIDKELDRALLDCTVEESMVASAALVRATCTAENVDPNGLVLHSDNGGPMKCSTTLATLQHLGIVPSFSCPSVSDDNPFIESLFRTLKYRPEYPQKPFDTIEAARAWVTAFVAWYNAEHRHSGIRFVTPDERHRGRENDVLANRERSTSVHGASIPIGGPPERGTGRRPRGLPQPKTRSGDHRERARPRDCFIRNERKATTTLTLTVYAYGAFEPDKLEISMGACKLHVVASVSRSVPGDPDPSHVERGIELGSADCDPDWTAFRFVPGARYAVEARLAGLLVARLTFQTPVVFPSLTAASRSTLSWAPFTVSPADSVRVTGFHLAHDAYGTMLPSIPISPLAGVATWDASDPSADHAFLLWGRPLDVSGLSTPQMLFHYWIHAF